MCLHYLVKLIAQSFFFWNTVYKANWLEPVSNRESRILGAIGAVHRTCVFLIIVFACRRRWHCTRRRHRLLTSRARRYDIGLRLKHTQTCERGKLCGVIASSRRPGAAASVLKPWMLPLVGAAAIRCAICETTPERNGCSGNPSSSAPLRLCPSSHKHCITVTKYSVDGKWLLDRQQLDTNAAKLSLGVLQCGVLLYERQ